MQFAVIICHSFLFLRLSSSVVLLFVVGNCSSISDTASKKFLSLFFLVFAGQLFDSVPFVKIFLSCLKKKNYQSIWKNIDIIHSKLRE